MAFEWKVVPAFGGGLNLSGHPVAIDDSEWSWSNGWEVKDGTAQTMVPCTQVCTAATYVPVDDQVVGIVPDLIAGAHKALVVTRHSTASTVRLWQINTAASNTAVEKVVTGTAPQSSYTAASPYGPALTPCLLNATQLLPLGVGTRSLATYDGTNIARVDIANTSACYGCVTQGRLVIANIDGTSPLRVRVSDANAPTTLTPAVSNSADDFTLDGMGAITGIAPTRDGAILLGEDRLWMLRSTGGIPPFSVTFLREGGSAGQVRRQFITGTPYGTVYLAGGQLWLEEGLVPSWTKVRPYVDDAAVLNINDDARPPKMLWDFDRRALVIPMSTDRWYADLASGAWYRIAWEATPLDHTILLPSVVRYHYCFVTSAGAVYRQSTSTASPVSGGFVDTKDFVFGTPAMTAYVDRIKVEWEQLSGDATLTVQGYARNHFTAANPASAQHATDFTSSFTTLGTLTTGSSEIPIRLRGKYIRFRFLQVSGGVRLRGFSIRWTAATDKTI